MLQGNQILFRRKRILIGSAVVIVVLMTGYACLPWVLTALLKQQLSTLGFSDVQIRINYPGWHKLHVSNIVLRRKTTAQHLLCKIPKIEISYKPLALLTGKLDKIRLPLLELALQSAPTSQSTDSSSSNLPLALLSGQWLVDFPVQEIVLDKFSGQVKTGQQSAYRITSAMSIRESRLVIQGELNVAAIKQPLRYSLTSEQTGKSAFELKSTDQLAEPLLVFNVNPLTEARQERLTLHGSLKARLDELMPIMAEQFTNMKSAVGITGEMSSQWQAQLTESDWRVTGDVTVKELTGQWAEYPLPRMTLNAQYDANPQQIEFKQVLDAVDKAVELEAAGHYQISDGTIQAKFSLQPVSFTTSGFVLSQLLDNWSYPFDVNSGQLHLNGKLTWQKKLRMEGRLQLDKLGGRYKDIAFAGLSSDLAFAKDEGFRTIRDAWLKVDLVEPGFPVEKLNADFALLARPNALLPAVDLKKFHAGLLGGKVKLTPFIFDMQGDNNAFVVQLEQLGLNEIMALEKQQGLAGTGILDGEIPIAYSSKGLLVKQGHLTARPPGGVIRFTPDERVAAMAQSNTSVEMVVKVLKNFEYQVLNMKSDYQRGGDLLLRIQLQGKNPDWQNGLPVRLNLNLQENIPALLRSLQLSDDISERMQNYYEGAGQDK